MPNSTLKEDADLTKQASTHISKELESIGYSVHKLRVKSSHVKILEFLENHDSNSLPVYSTGSHTEGVDVSGSDRDAMVVFPNVSVITSLTEMNEADCPESNDVFIMVKDNVRPCYTKLKLVRESATGENWLTRLGGKERLCQQNINKEWFLSSERFAELTTRHVSDILESSSAHKMTSFHVHGPCATFDNTVGKTIFDTDFAFCLPCSHWPDEAVSLIKRERLFDWPPQSLLAKGRTFGCHLVAVGDHSSQTASLEWRISYAVLERELVWSLNDTQCKCYVMLKLLTKHFVETKIPDKLTSYVIKTLLFWLAEEENPTIWKEENLVQCVYMCMTRLYECNERRRLRHYVVPENNLLLTKLDDPATKIMLMELLKEMVTWHWSSFFQCKALSNLKTIWDEYRGDMKSFLRYARHPNLKSLLYKDLTSFRSLQSMYMNISIFSNLPHIYKRMRKLVTEIPSDVDNTIVDVLRKVIAMRLYFINEDTDLVPVTEEKQSLHEGSGIRYLDEEVIYRRKTDDRDVQRSLTDAPQLTQSEGNDKVIIINGPEMDENVVKNEDNDTTKSEDKIRAVVFNIDIDKTPENLDEQKIIYNNHYCQKDKACDFEEADMFSVYTDLQSQSVDVCSGMLHLSIRFYKEGKLEEADRKLNELLSAYDAHVLYIGLCGPEEITELDTIEYLCYVTSVGEMTIVEKMNRCLALDFCICKFDLVPPVLEYEKRTWEEKEVALYVHPRVLLYYMMSLTFHGQGRMEEARGAVTTLSMTVAITTRRKGLYAYIAWNLLGHCYFILKKYRRAVRAFKMSLAIKSIRNPALLYIGMC